MTRQRLLALAFCLAAVAVAAGTLIPGAGRWLPFHAPLATHVAAFTLIGVMARLAMQESQRAMRDSLIMALGLGMAAETMQLAVPDRTFTMLDLFANLGGAAAGVLLAGLVVESVRRIRFEGSNGVNRAEPD